MPIQNQFRRTYALTFNGAVDTVFPLLCPVREYEWIPGWSCELIHSRSGVIEPGCVFKTRQADTDLTWYVAAHDPAHHHVDFVITAPNLFILRFSIDLEPAPRGCVARIVQEFTALSPATDLDGIARDRMTESLETLMNAYLAKAAGES
jgi:hypothetical protein